MKRVRIKVKHLIFMAIGIIAAVMYILPNALFIYAKAAEKSNVEASKVYYKRYIEMFPFGSKRAEALYNLASSIIPENLSDLRYKIFSNGSSSWSKVITEQMIDNAANYYKEVIGKYKDSQYYTKSYGQLLNILVMGGRFDEAEEIINRGLESNDEDIRLTALKFRMQSFMIGRQYDEARRLGQGLIDGGKADSDIYMLMGDISFYERKLDDAAEHYNKAASGWNYLNAKENTRIMEASLGVHPSQKKELVNKLKNGYIGSGEIRGKVTINGKPAPNVYVYLKNQNDDGFNGIGDEDRHINALTDYNGEYVIPSLPEGTYVIGIGLFSSYLENTLHQASNVGYLYLGEGESKSYDFNFVPPIKLIRPNGNTAAQDGKIELEWEPVQGAAYYYLRLIAFEKPGMMNGNYVTFGVNSDITDTKFAIDIDKVNMEPSGFMMDEEGMLNPQAYLGAFYPGSRVPVFLEAYSSDGRLITGSRPIISSISDMIIINAPDDNLSEGDRLVLDRKPEEAVKAYEKALGSNPDDIHSMMVLSKLYSMGTRRKPDPGREDITEGTDPERARELLERLYNLTGKYCYLKAQFDRYILQPEDYREAVERYKSIPVSEMNDGDFTRIAELSLSIKDYSGADDYFEKVYELKKHMNHYDLMPVVLNMYLGEIEDSLRFLSILDVRLYKVDKDKLYSDITKLKDLDKTDGEYRKFQDALKVLIDKDDKDYRQLFKEMIEDVEDPLLYGILRSVGSYYSVFDLEF